MPETRAKTGNSRPRIFPPAEPTTTTTKTTVRKKKPAAKANTSKPRAKTTATGRVTKKKKAPAQKIKDKVEGVALKAEGKVTGKSGKKVRSFFVFFSLFFLSCFKSHRVFFLDGWISCHSLLLSSFLHWFVLRLCWAHGA